MNCKSKRSKTIMGAVLLLGIHSSAFAYDATDIKYLFSIYGVGVEDMLKHPRNIFVDDVRSEIYVIGGDETIMVFDMNGILLYKFGRSQGIRSPRGLVVDSGGAIYISRGMKGDLLVCNYRGEIDHRFKFTGITDLIFPWQMEIDEEDNLYVVDQKDKRVLVFNNREELKFQIKNEDDRFFTISDITVDTSGRIYVMNGVTSKIYVFDDGSNFLFDFGQHGGGIGRTSGPVGIVVDPHGMIWVLDTNRQKILVYDKEGEFKFEFGALGIGDMEFRYPSDIAMDTGGRIYIADSLNNRIQVLKLNL